MIVAATWEASRRALLDPAIERGSDEGNRNM